MHFQHCINWKSCLLVERDHFLHIGSSTDLHEDALVIPSSPHQRTLE